ncbi:MFS transporter [Nocardia sp. NPDC058176]|uniref:MFS transporter n=1 Tax=Nocardia sp. NPDC058176 TaxID=3346368 RepID=UPI0036DD2F2C
MKRGIEPSDPVRLDKAEDTRWTPRQRLALSVVVLASSLLAIDLTVVAVALPTIGADFATSSLATLEWVMVGYALMFGSLVQPAGALSDRIGGRRMFLTGMTLLVAASIGCAVSPNIWTLLGFRAGQGLAAAVMFATMIPLLARTFDQAQRPMAIAIWTAVTSIAGIMGPLVGGGLVEAGGWRWMFWINIPLGAAALALAARVLAPDPPPAKGTRFDWVGAALLAVSVGSLTYAFTLAHTRAWLDPAVLATLAVAVTGIAIFRAWIGTRPAPVLDKALLRNPPFVGVAMLAVVNRVATFGATIYFMLYLHDGHGYSALQAATLLVPLGIAGIAGAIAGGKIQSRVRSWLVLAVGNGLLAVAAAILVWQIYAMQNPLWLIPTLAVWGFGNSLANVPIMKIATESVPAEQVGMATGLINSFFPLGGSLGAVVLGLVFNAVGSGERSGVSLERLGHGTAAVYAVVAVCCVAGVAVAATLVRARP